MGMTVSCGIHPEASQEKYLWVGTKRAGADHKGVGSAERCSGVGDSVIWQDRFERFKIKPPAFPQVHDFVHFPDGVSLAFF